jgi:serine-type D-Ala-D-Ala carboxypeptidase (penicillin-binding protein 5/6)
MDALIRFLLIKKWQMLVVIGLIFVALVTPPYSGSSASRSTDISPEELPYPNLPLVNNIPVKIASPSALLIQAEAVIAIDPDSGSILYQKNPDKRLLPASTTKIMTALVALTDYQLDEVITITDADQSIGQRAQIQSGEQLTVQHLLYALMLPSGNDAAVALAQHYPGGYFAFVARMNQLAQTLNLQNTHFTNVSGIESPDHYSTARDLALLTKEALKNHVFAQIVATSETTIQSLDGTKKHQLYNRNELLGNVDGVQGVKTGWTLNAGECLVTFVVRNNRPVITVVLNSPDRFGESAMLIEWLYANYNWLPYHDLLRLISNDSLYSPDTNEGNIAGT